MLLGATLEYITNENESPVFLKCSKLADESMMHSKSTCLGASLLQKKGCCKQPKWAGCLESMRTLYLSRGNTSNDLVNMF